MSSPDSANSADQYSDEDKPIAFNVGNYNFSYLRYVRDKKNYKVFTKDFNTNKYSRMRFVTPNMFIPFGLESYQKKAIVNIEFPKNDNFSNNFLGDIQQIDKFFLGLKSESFREFYRLQIPKDLIDNIEKKLYVSCLRQKDGFQPMLRTHAKTKGVSIQSVFYDSSQNVVPIGEIKKRYAKLTLEIGPIWYTNTSYGIVLYLNGGRLV